jgi:hypothetical protein
MFLDRKLHTSAYGLGIGKFGSLEKEIEMRHVRVGLVAIVLFLMIFNSACSPKPVATVAPVFVTDAPTEAPAATEAATEAPEATEAPTQPASIEPSAEPQFPSFDVENFENSTVIDNPWMPMKPGTKWVYEGTALDDAGNKVDRRIEFTVTDLTKEIDGVRTVVGWIEDFNNGQVNEKEIAFYGQDKSGNVWYFGEHPEDYQNGQFVEAPTWIAGFQDAKPGIQMLAKPETGMQDVYEGWGPAVDWSDYAHTDQMGQETCVPVSCYKDVVVNAEANLTEKGAVQLKYFASGVGEVQVGWRGNDDTKEELKLVEFKQLSPEELANIHAQALALEKHAYEVSPDAYGQTAPMQ